MLTDRNTLSTALDDFTVRNKLIRRLTRTNPNKPNFLEKLTLAFWLGSNTVFSMRFNGRKVDRLLVGERVPHYAPYVVSGYLLFLELDKAISQLALTASPDAIVLRAWRERLFFIYNEDSATLVTAPGILFQRFAKELVVMSDAWAQPPHESFAEKLQTTLFTLLLPLLRNPLAVTSQSDVIAQYKHQHRSDLSWHNLRELVLQIICWWPGNYYFLNTTLKDYSTHQVNKLYFPARDGVILSGIEIRKRGSESDYVVLALIGHFQTEHSYLTYNFNEFQRLFDTDIVFLNHRNYSDRAAVQAQSVIELGHDIADIADYFVKKNKQLVLYGMCGGAMIMSLAAAELRQKEQRFKLILDRVAQNYMNWASLKTLWRAYLLESTPQLRSQYAGSRKFEWLWMVGVVPLVIALLWLEWLLRSLFFLTQQNFSVPACVAVLPEQDVLILQAKDPKANGDLGFTDVVVHPDNDLRNVTKPARHAHRVLLNNLSEDCRYLGVNLPETMAELFFSLYRYFEKCLQLIENEKLTAAFTRSGSGDLHRYPLFDLQTHNNMPLTDFLGGFFKAPPKERVNRLGELAAYSEAMVVTVVESLDYKLFHRESMVFHLSRFLNGLFQNKDYLCYITDRALMSGVGDSNVLVEKLYASEVFQALRSVKVRSGLGG